MSDVAQLLNAMDRGDRQAAADLLSLVYEELRKLAAAKMAHDNPGQNWQATALVHEAWLRLVGDESTHVEGCGHFFAAAAAARRRSTPWPDPGARNWKVPMSASRACFK